jgi:hypothetical protein
LRRAPGRWLSSERGQRTPALEVRQVVLAVAGDEGEVFAGCEPTTGTDDPTASVASRPGDPSRSRPGLLQPTFVLDRDGEMAAQLADTLIAAIHAQP